MPNTRETNSPETWNKLWSDPESRDWRKDVLAPVYKRIAELIPRGSKVVDLGGGVGHLAEVLRDEASCDVEVWEHNEAARAACEAKNIATQSVDIEHSNPPWEFAIPTGSAIVSTEVLEHLSEAALQTVMHAARGRSCFFSVPNDRLPPSEEPQHARSWTALEFLNFLRGYFPDARVEVLGPRAEPSVSFPSHRGQPAFLLGICGMGEKKEKVSVTFPARDEEADIEKCLASLRGVADEMVIGIDPRSKDATKVLAQKYAEVVFELPEILGPPGEEVPEGGIHFAHARNNCMARCQYEWIMMTEAHEPLVDGHEVFFNLDQIEKHLVALFVVRQGGVIPHREHWIFPWLCRNRPTLRYARATHNTLEGYEWGVTTAIVPMIKTLHERVHTKTAARAKQRSVQNRTTLMEDWLATMDTENPNEWSLHYLGAEWREHDPLRACARFREYLMRSKYGTLRYHTRLVLAKTLINLPEKSIRGFMAERNVKDVAEAKRKIEAEARAVLLDATQDDWSRIEHWVFLGDLALEAERYEEALTFYLYATTKRNNAPLMTWWVDLAMYSWIPAQRLARTYAAMGLLDESLAWGKLVLEDFLSYGEDETPAELIREAEENIKLLEDAIHAREQRQAAE